MPTNIVISRTSDLTVDLSVRKRTMSSSETDVRVKLITENDEIKIFECEIHEDDKSERLSPVVKDEESLIQANNDRLNNEQQFQSFFPYFISPYYQNNNNLPVFEKMSSLESLSKYMSSPPAHLSNLNASIDQNTGMLNPIYSLPPSPYSQPWRSSMFPFVFPPEYSYSSKDLTPIHHNFNKNNSPQRESKQRLTSDEHKSKKSHIKKPLNAFMLFMKEQRSLVVQECTLRESAAINQILGRKWHELDRNVQQKYYDMARDERMKHMQLYPEWSARDNYGARKKRTVKGKKRERNQECLNQKKCRARFGLEQQANWCKHCKRKKKCLRYTENDFIPNTNPSSSDDDDDTDTIEDSNDGDVIQIIQADHHHQPKITIDSDEENKLRLLKYRFKDY